jgi:hypothetical protein
MTIEAATGSEFIHIVISLGVLLFAAKIKEPNEIQYFLPFIQQSYNRNLTW